MTHTAISLLCLQAAQRQLQQQIDAAEQLQADMEALKTENLEAWRQKYDLEGQLAAARANMDSMRGQAESMQQVGAQCVYPNCALLALCPHDIVLLPTDCRTCVKPPFSCQMPSSCRTFMFASSVHLFSLLAFPIANLQIFVSRHTTPHSAGAGWAAPAGADLV